MRQALGDRQFSALASGNGALCDRRKMSGFIRNTSQAEVKMASQNYRDLVAWQKAMDLVVAA
jgi:hypothetical protein